MKNTKKTKFLKLKSNFETSYQRKSLASACHHRVATTSDILPKLPLHPVKKIKCIDQPIEQFYSMYFSYFDSTTYSHYDGSKIAQYLKLISYRPSGLRTLTKE